MRIAVVDGQGGGLGQALVSKIKEGFGKQVDVLALGTNALATAAMLRAGADEGATGENAVVVNSGKVVAILGAVGILVADSMLGELTPAMAKAIATSPAQKILIPLNRCGITILGVRADKMAGYVQEALERVGELVSAQGPQANG
nr:DUF3842 family protein [bacterium]